MRIAWIVLVIVTNVAHAACGGVPALRDWGLHREWQVQCDPAHPERPARLVETPWSAEYPQPDCRFSAQKATTGQKRAAIAPGARVDLWRREGDADVHLRGAALEAGSIGDEIRVRVQWNGATRRGWVRSPGLVELRAGRPGER